MIRFPDGLYSDVRLEESCSTLVRFALGELEEQRVRDYRAAFIRVFDGRRWYFAATSDSDCIQSELDSIALLASPNRRIRTHPVVEKLQFNTGRHFSYDDNPVSDIDEKSKVDLLSSYFPLLSGRNRVKNWTALYQDRRQVKRFMSSIGADITFDTQNAGFMFGFGLASGDRRLTESFHRGGTGIGGLDEHHEAFREKLETAEDFLEHSMPVKPGTHTVILSPFAAGIFAHESFGHKSEADFMVGDETMLREWAMGSRVGAEILSIVDDGNEPGTGYVPFDDEGTRATKTWLVRNGILSGRLHSASTAADLGEEVTGNARSVSYEYEPIPRMTTTYIEPGTKTKKDLFSEVANGIFVDTINHGSGLSTFTMAPSMSWMIRDGRLDEPVSISVISGNVMETLSDIDGLSDTLELFAIPAGGCGKMDQAPLPVGFGGPFVRISRMNVQ